ncbi:hypothetical protein [Pyrobaculum ferrireducens]|uniref:Uncharacterized protein n=1 Tax=Pyrobaculum ferrireducens TaxID=1104324 RepID=G7VDZ2_9CREN|nr:hypothetical protein [Pyrobaculum ferrireducens]AET31574.1 hypothetical protein P186_0106 [Pyrobaculum ferrireducens]
MLAIHLLITLAAVAQMMSPSVAVNTCSFNDVVYVVSGQYTWKSYHLPSATDVWMGDAVTNVPEVYYTYYWDSNSKTLTAIFFDLGPESGYVTYKVYFTTQGACPTEPPKGTEIVLKAYRPKVVDKVEPVSTKPRSITAVERILPAYKAQMKQTK